MKRTLILFVSVLLVGSSTAFGEEGFARRLDQETERPRRVEISRPSFLGVELEEVTHDSAQRLKLRSERGAVIESVTPDSSAAKAGLKKDDVIVKWNGEAIESAGEVSRRIRETPAGRTIRLGIVRDGSDTESTVTLGERSQYVSRMRDAAAAAVTARPPRVPRAPSQPREPREPREPRIRVADRYRLGVSVQGMSPQLAEYFGLTGRNGALVVYVYPDSPAAKSGIKAGDVILSIGGQATENPVKVHEALQTKSEGAVDVRVMRDRQERTLTLQLEKGKTSWLIAPDEFDLAESGGRIISIPRIHIDPVHIPATIVPLTRLEVTPAIDPIVVPQFTIPEISVPRINVRPMKIVLPFRLRITV